MPSASARNRLYTPAQLQQRAFLVLGSGAVTVRFVASVPNAARLPPVTASYHAAYHAWLLRTGHTG